MKGKVYLVGAGPGDPELMTLRAVRALGEADVVLVDDLVNEECLRYTRARVLRVGKRAGCKSTPQTFIERLMVRLARRGKVVARLKGGDPFVFGRGGEEVLELRKNAIPFEVIPGITAGLATGIPVTHRGLARGATFLSGHTSNHDWAALRASGTTLVIYMGVARLGAIVAQMLAAGFPPATPAYAVEDATLPTERAIPAFLAELPSLEIKTPAVIIIGEVARLPHIDEKRIRAAARNRIA